MYSHRYSQIDRKPTPRRRCPSCAVSGMPFGRCERRTPQPVLRPLKRPSMERALVSPTASTAPAAFVCRDGLNTAATKRANIMSSTPLTRSNPAALVRSTVRASVLASLGQRRETRRVRGLVGGRHSVSCVAAQQTARSGRTFGLRPLADHQIRLIRGSWIGSSNGDSIAPGEVSTRTILATGSFAPPRILVRASALARILAVGRPVVFPDRS